MKDREGVLKAKAEITEKAHAVVVHADDDLLPRLAAEYEARGQQVALLGTRTRAGDVVLFRERPSRPLPVRFPCG